MTRRETMRQIELAAKRDDARGDVVGRRQAADTWRELATEAEARRAPRYLTWTGRWEALPGSGSSLSRSRARRARRTRRRTACARGLDFV